MKKILFTVMFLLTTVAGAQHLKDIKHVVVASEKDKFHAWPANNGSWNWGDEILVGFTQGEFKIQRGHDIDGQQVSLMARSLDGGETWKMFDPDGFLDSDQVKFDGRGKRKLEGPIDFTHSGFGMRVFAEGYHGNDDPEGGFYYTYDRGKTWNGPYYLGGVNSHPEMRGKALSPRTDYIVQDKNTCLVFVSARPNTPGSWNRMACLRTEDGGKSFDFVSWVTPAKQTENAIMSQTIQLSKTDLLLTYRNIVKTPPDPSGSRKPSSIEGYVSRDNGETWSHLSTVIEIGGGQSNPPALIKMKDGRLCCIYGDRHRVKMLGRYSKDDGKTWGEEFVIRDNYGRSDNSDFGYPRLMQRKDGKLVAMYYWATKEIPQQFIAASIWSPK